MGKWYTLVNKTPIEIKDWKQWAGIPSNRLEWRVAFNEIDGIQISTVFLGLDHSYDGSVPILFETMIFGGDLDQEMERYTTWELAESGHIQMVQRVKDSLAKTKEE